jgi:hypothetical protein
MRLLAVNESGGVKAHLHVAQTRGNVAFCCCNVPPITATEFKMVFFFFF